MGELIIISIEHMKKIFDSSENRTRAFFCINHGTKALTIWLGIDCKVEWLENESQVKFIFLGKMLWKQFCSAQLKITSHKLQSVLFWTKPMHYLSQNKITQKNLNFLSLFESSQVWVWCQNSKLDSTWNLNIKVMFYKSKCL